MYEIKLPCDLMRNPKQRGLTAIIGIGIRGGRLHNMSCLEELRKEAEQLCCYLKIKRTGRA
jgi:hypothetical protein